MDRAEQIVWLVLVPLPVAWVSWTVTKEEIFREWREYCQRRARDEGAPRWQQKLFYMFTCEYCFSHYVTAAIIGLAQYRLLLDDWRGYVFAFGAVVWLANIYMSFYSRVRVDIQKDKAVIGDVKAGSADGAAPARYRHEADNKLSKT